MRIIMLFNYIDDYFWYRYKPQIMPIAERVDEFTILAYTGRKPKQDEVEVIMFNREIGPNPTLEMVKRHILEMYGMTLFRKLNRRYEVARKFVNTDCDLVYCLSGGAIQQTLHYFMKRLRPEVPMIHRMRGDGEKHRSYLMKPPHRWIHNWVARYSLNCYDWHIPINDEMYRKLRQFGIPRDKITSPIGLGVDTETFKPEYHNNDRLTCGYFGRMSKEKGLDFLFKLMRQTPEIDYVLLGKREDRLPPLPPNCTDLGYVQHKDMPRMYGMVDLVLLPSYMEGVSNIFPEAYACGKPVMCSPQARDISLPLYGYEQQHHIIQWKQVLNDVTVDRLREKGRAAREWAEGYTWDHFGERMVEEFKKVLE